MSQLALYRKYRSASLGDVVGQDHITKTLSAALSKGKINHAYLFTGPRGVGKTSVARIMARSINNLDAEQDNPNFLDIIEIDAASNRGIDEIRSLREKVAVAPAKLKYKVYIIDEAHMLTREAFNALLKTLEEPPSHVVFILATTEAHKLPETIISRTQRYDFHAFSEAEIVSRLQYIAGKENIKITNGSLELIAQLASGGMRDAISLLDQLAVLDGEIDEKLTSQFLGLAPGSELDDLINNCIQNQASEAVAKLEQIIAGGVAPSELVLQLQRLVRERLVESIGTDDQAKTRFYVRSLEALQQAANQQAFSANSYIPLELAVVKLSLGPAQPEVLVEPNAQVKVVPPLDVAEPNSPTPIPTSQTQGLPGEPAKSSDIALCDKALSQVKENNNSLYALLRSGGAHVDANKLMVNCRFAFHQNRIEEHHNRALVEKIMSKTFGRSIQLSCQLENGPLPVEKADVSEELVSSAMAILGGELVE